MLFTMYISNLIAKQVVLTVFIEIGSEFHNFIDSIKMRDSRTQWRKSFQPPNICQRKLFNFLHVCPHAFYMSSMGHPHFIRKCQQFIHMSSTCHPHPIYMSSTSDPHVIHMSSLCHPHVVHMVYMCHQHIIVMSSTSDPHVSPLSFTSHLLYIILISCLIL